MQPTSSQSELTAYNVDGLELYFTPNRKVYAHVTAIARMCGMSQGAVYSYVRAQLENQAVTPVKATQGKHSNLIILYPASVIVLCLKKYNTARLAQFTEFGLDEGLAQMAGVPLPAITHSKTRTDLEMAQQYVEMAQQYVAMLQERAKQEDFLSNKPGLAHKMDAAQSEQPQLPSSALYSFDELCEHVGYPVLDVFTKREASRKLASAILNDTLVKVGTKYVHKPGKNQTRYVRLNAYPLEAVPAFKNVMNSLGFNWLEPSLMEAP